MSSKTFKVKSKDLKEAVYLTTILSFKLLLVKTLIKDSDCSDLKKLSDF